MFKSELMRTLDERGYINQCSNLEGLDELANTGKITAYVGYDCTAKSLHVGSLISIMMLRIIQKTGHQPLVIMGGGTTKVGDPSGKDEQRQMLSDEAIADNMKNLGMVFSKFINFGNGPTDAIMVNNADWLESLGYITFLREVGRHFTINKMLTFDSVKLRLEREQPLTFLEFNYMLMQAYDFVELFKRYNCRLQMGGSDQWGNIINGVDLGRRMGTDELFCLTTHLLTTNSGKKMGKTADGAIWLNGEMLSSFDYWQFWRNTEDSDVERFLKLYTELPLSEVARLAKLQGREINEAKIILANEATRLLHGEEAARAAMDTAKSVFEQGGVGGELPIYALQAAEVAQGVALVRLLVLSGLCSSNSEARRLIAGGGARVNNQVVRDDKLLLGLQDFSMGEVKLSQGQKKHVLVRLAQ